MSVFLPCLYSAGGDISSGLSAAAESVLCRRRIIVAVEIVRNARLCAIRHERRFASVSTSMRHSADVTKLFVIVLR